MRSIPNPIRIASDSSPATNSGKPGSAKPGPADFLRQGFQAHQSGRLGEAERLYRKALAADHRLADGHHLLGLVLHQRGRSADGLVSVDRALARAPLAAGYHLSRGSLLASLGAVAGAASAFRRALALRPGDGLAFRNLATAALGMDDAGPAFAWSGRAVLLDPGDATGWTARAHAARRCGAAGETARAAAAALRLDPSLEEARFLLDSVAGDPARPPAGYVRDLFDKYAGHFDRDLVDRLQYRTPDALAELVARHLAPGAKSLSILDLGCGTGLAGLAFAPIARRLVGLDLSAEMLARARARKIYADLLQEDLVAAAFGETFDLVVAADVLNYLGDLGPALAAIDQALVSSGAVAFSIEIAESEGQAFRLTGDLRYTHAPAPLRMMAAQLGWTETAHEGAVLRRQGDRPVDGLLFLFRKP